MAGDERCEVRGEVREVDVDVDARVAWCVKLWMQSRPRDN